MARVFWDGFDSYPSVAALDTVWPGRAYNPSFTNGRFAPGQAITLKAISGGAYLGRFVEGVTTDRHSLGVACYPTGNNFGSQFGWGFFRQGEAAEVFGACQIRWRRTELGAIAVYRGSANSAESLLWKSDDGIFPLNNWSYVGFSALIHVSQGAFSVTLNGEPLVEMTNVNTQGQEDTDIAYVGFTSSSKANAGEMTCDDVYFDDEYLSMVPERRVETLYPNADGATLGLTPSTGTDHFALIDEAQMDASDYLAGSTVGQLDEFGLTDLSNIPRSIDGVKVVGYASKSDAAARAWNFGLRTANNVDVLGPDHYIGASTAQKFSFALLNPETGAKWTPAQVNALRLLARVAV